MQVHGGLTYASHEDNLWWLGFDCAHGCDDVVPGCVTLARLVFPGAEYRTLEYTCQETERLAEQLKALSP